jgi:hypothetical protein
MRRRELGLGGAAAGANGGTLRALRLGAVGRGLASTAAPSHAGGDARDAGPRAH